jgi:stage II sporulation protein D
MISNVFKFSGIIWFLFFLYPATVFSSEPIRVAIADDQRSVTLRSSSGLMWAGSSSDLHEKKLVFSPGSVGAKPVRIKSADDATQVNGRRYRGWVEIRKKRNGLLLVINELDLESYLYGVVASEIPHDWEFEALKAQAVAARTYALYQKRTAGNRSYHILATVNSQVYRGVDGERPRAVRAVRNTQGIIIVYEGRVIPAFYHSNCGGQTEDAAELWGIDLPYLKGVDCDCQVIVQDELWEKRISTATVARALSRLGYRLGTISDVNVAKITPAGRVQRVAVRSEEKTTLVPGDTFRTALGHMVIPSVFFEMEILGDDIVFSGRGRGHGVGLCQWGAKEMAQKGHDFTSILSRYYPGTSLARIKER